MEVQGKQQTTQPSPEEKEDAASKCTKTMYSPNEIQFCANVNMLGDHYIRSIRLFTD